jgi:hypothetical protein
MSQAVCRPALVEKAMAIFAEWSGRAPTGAGGLTRKEMRLLERAGYVEGKIAKLPSGSEVNVWTWKGPR